jgi:hypothetical protein
MAIQEIEAYSRLTEAGGDRRVSGVNKEVQEGTGRGGTDLASVSGEAKALYDAGQNQKSVTIYERLRTGYYMKKDVLNRIVDALEEEMKADREAHVPF